MMQRWTHCTPSISVVLTIVSVTISACSDPKQQLLQQLEDGSQYSDEQPSGVPLAPLESVVVMPPYVYQAPVQRSPFWAAGMSTANVGSSVSTQQNQSASVETPPSQQTLYMPTQDLPKISQPSNQAGSADVLEPIVQGPLPDASRPRQPLEAYALNQLTYRGMIVIRSVAYGLVQRPDGAIVRVQVGEYLGGHSGRIVELTATQVNLIETVFDPQVGYKQVSASLIAPVLSQ